MRRAEPIAALGGLLLVVSLFLPWYASARGRDVSGFDRAVRASTCCSCCWPCSRCWCPISSLASDGPTKPVSVAVLGSAFGWIAILLVVFRIVDVPVDGYEVRYGAWMALAGAIIAWVGSWLSLSDESTPGAAAPDVPVRPAPSALRWLAALGGALLAVALFLPWYTYDTERTEREAIEALTARRRGPGQRADRDDRAGRRGLRRVRVAHFTVIDVRWRAAVVVVIVAALVPRLRLVAALSATAAVGLVILRIADHAGPDRFQVCLLLPLARRRRLARAGRSADRGRGRLGLVAPRLLRSPAMLSRDQVLHVARLARLELTPEEVERFGGELSKVLDHIELIAELGDLSDVAPTSHVIDVENALRADEPRPSMPVEKALENAPDAADGGFRVPSPGAS